MITATLLAVALASLGAATLALAALLLARHGAPAWEKCPDCNWYHRDCQFQLKLPRGETIARIRQCACCATLARLEHQKRFSRQCANTDGQQ